MTGKITVVINTYNEEAHIERAIKSVSWADEILVCDMHSEDNTAVLAKKLGAVVFFHKKTGFVEPARNFAISKASHEWILVVDADEEVPDSLQDKLKDIIKKNGVVTHVEVPRKNLIFGKWMKAAGWWPDYNIRFFKKDSVIWSNKIHSKPKTVGQGLTLSAEERYAITHHHYSNVSQFIARMNRYTDVQAREMRNDGYQFDWKDVIKKPMGEFMSRYFAHRGFDDGLHGLALSLLQAFSHLVMMLKVWEASQFEKKQLGYQDVVNLMKTQGEELHYWFKYSNLSKNPIKRTLQKIKNKLSK